jgi:hypothetical protein
MPQRTLSCTRRGGCVVMSNPDRFPPRRGRVHRRSGPPHARNVSISRNTCIDSARSDSSAESLSASARIAVPAFRRAALTRASRTTADTGEPPFAVPPTGNRHRPSAAPRGELTSRRIMPWHCVTRRVT